MFSLTELAEKYGTDKLEHGYLPYYEQYITRIGPLTLLEIGVWEGASLRMWRDWLPDAKIVGLDKYDRAVSVDGVQIIQCEQDSKEDLLWLSKALQGFDVIIDDASHISSKTIASFVLLYPHLKPGGVYVIEDLQTSYDVEHYGPNEALANPNSHLVEYPYTAMGFCKRLADEVNNGLFPSHYSLNYDLESVQFFPNICFITKKG